MSAAEHLVQGGCNVMCRKGAHRDIGGKHLRQGVKQCFYNCAALQQCDHQVIRHGQEGVIDLSHNLQSHPPQLSSTTMQEIS
jgi:hypothetical protein